MNKFEIKAFECELLGDIYNSLESKKNCYMQWDGENYVKPTDEYYLDRLAIIEEVMKRLEKLI